MSANICNPEHIGLLAAYAVQQESAIPEWRVSLPGRSTDDNPGTAANIAQQLLLANIKSVMVRYPDGKPGDLPGPCLDLDDQVLAVQAYARHYLTRPRSIASTVDILKAAAGYDYQACEPGDWETTRAARQVRWIVSAAHRQLPGWEESDAWSWTEEKSIASIDALYNKAS